MTLESSGKNRPSNGNQTSRLIALLSIMSVSGMVMGAVIVYTLQYFSQDMVVATNQSRVVNIAMLQKNLSERTNDILNGIAKLKSDMIEINTQFCNNDNVNNIMNVNDNRNFRILWAKIFLNEQLINVPLYPRTCKTDK